MTHRTIESWVTIIALGAECLDTRAIIFIISTTIVAGIFAFWIRNRKTKKALKEIEADMRELQEFSK